MDVDKEDTWITDSGASRHISYLRELFGNFRQSKGGTVVLGNDVKCKVKGESVILVDKLVDES